MICNMKYGKHLTFNLLAKERFIAHIACYRVNVVLHVLYCVFVHLFCFLSSDTNTFFTLWNTVKNNKAPLYGLYVILHLLNAEYIEAKSYLKIQSGYRGGAGI